MSLSTPRLALPYPETSDTADVPRDVRALAERVEALTAWIRQQDFAPGVGVHSPGDLKLSAAPAPTGADPKPWLECDGSAVSRVTYGALFAAIGTAYGVGDGSSTFNLPDLRGRVPIGQGQGDPIGGVAMTNRTLGAKVGEEVHKLTTAELAPHNHASPPSAAFVTQVVSGGFAFLADAGTYRANTTTGTENTGGNVAHNNTAASTVVTVLIKT